MATTATPKTLKLPKRYKPGFLRGLDRRSAASRQLRRDFNAIADDLGGEQNLSVVTLTLIEHYVFLNYQIQQLERMLEKKPKDSEYVHNRWVAACNSLQGMAVKLGMKKAKSAKSNTLNDYLKDRRA